MPAELEIRLIDASPAERHAMDRSLGTPEQPQAAEAPAKSPSVAESSRDLVKIYRPDESLAKYAEQNQELEKTVGLFKRLHDELAGIFGAERPAVEKKPKDQSDNKPKIFRPEAAEKRPQRIDSFSQLTKELGDLFARHLPESVRAPLSNVANKVGGTIGRFVPQSVKDKVSRRAMIALRKFGRKPWKRFTRTTSLGKKVAQSSFGKVAARTLGINTARTAATGAVAATGTGATTGAAAAGAVAGAGATTAGAAGAGTAGAGAALAGIAATAGPVGIAVAAVAALGVAAVATTKALHDAADNIEDLSPQVAAVRAQRDIQSEINRMDRANRIGAPVAQNEAALGRLADVSERLLTSLLEIASKSAPVLEVGVDTLAATLEALNVIIQAAEAYIAATNPAAAALAGTNVVTEGKQVFDAAGRFVDATKEIFANNNYNDDQLKADFDAFIAQLNNAQQLRPNGPPRRLP